MLLMGVKEGISKAEFEQIQNGMSYDDVVAIIGGGGDGELGSEVTAEEYKISLYT
ncbi:hypothetical protein ACWKS2_22235 [Bacillus thuringiensis]|uniref:hypothetical protein n=1 Tax=Bacillus sp. HMA207 TaxID=2058879 RepID=UPI001F07C2C5|nr:hypothetical protein [Bacillus sp. HMA207]